MSEPGRALVDKGRPPTWRWRPSLRLTGEARGLGGRQARDATLIAEPAGADGSGCGTSSRRLEAVWIALGCALAITTTPCQRATAAAASRRALLAA